MLVHPPVIHRLRGTHTHARTRAHTHEHTHRPFIIVIVRRVISLALGIVFKFNAIAAEVVRWFVLLGKLLD